MKPNIACCFDTWSDKNVFLAHGKLGIAKKCVLFSQWSLSFLQCFVPFAGGTVVKKTKMGQLIFSFKRAAFGGNASLQPADPSIALLLEHPTAACPRSVIHVGQK